jgi:hypothetical protein
MDEARNPRRVSDQSRSATARFTPYGKLSFAAAGGPPVWSRHDKQDN